MSAVLAIPAFLGSFGGAIDFIFSQRESVQAGEPIGGLSQIWDLLATQMAVSILALVLVGTVLTLAPGTRTRVTGLRFGLALLGAAILLMGGW